MKKAKKEIATKRIHILFNNAVSNARTDAVLAEKQAKSAKKISMTVSYTHLTLPTKA